MRHIVTLKNNREFGKVYNQKESFANKYLVMYLRANNLDYSRIGISVSKKVGNSVCCFRQRSGLIKYDRIRFRHRL